MGQNSTKSKNQLKKERKYYKILFNNNYKFIHHIY